MPYATGTANSAADLRDAVVSLATANGWTWDATNEVLSKSPIYGQLTVDGLQLRLQAGLGVAGGALTTPSGKTACITDRFTAYGTTVLTYPVTYHIFLHSVPDTIWVSVNYGVSWWQHLAFGNTMPLGATVNPLWQFGSSWTGQDLGGIAVAVDGRGGAGSGNSSGVPFWSSNDVGTNYASMIYADFDSSPGWRHPPTYGDQSSASAAIGLKEKMAAAMLDTQPNAWNGETLLVRVTVAAGRPSGFSSYLAEMSDLRLLRNDNLADGQILTIGNDRWFTMPVYRKNAASRDESPYNRANHSGTFGFAISYDGP